MHGIVGRFVSYVIVFGGGFSDSARMMAGGMNNHKIEFFVNFTATIDRKFRLSEIIT